MKQIYLLLILILILCFGCSPNEKPKKYTLNDFVMGADLSYVNQVLDHGGVYRVDGEAIDPYELFSQEGCNLVRLRLWHDPSWTRIVYNDSSVTLYSGLEDVKRAIAFSKKNDMAVCLDFHYSDVWADPHRQKIPRDWEGLGIEVLKDSVYTYTKNVLEELKSEDLLPEYVQIGNETNPGLLHPVGYYELSGWQNTVDLLNAGLIAVAAVNASLEKPIQSIIHIAQPENVRPWFERALSHGLHDFDIIGLSYYCKWSSVPLDSLPDYLASFRKQFQKEVMVVETAYPFTLKGADDYPNIFGEGIEEFPVSQEGQLNYLIALTQAIIDGGGTGIMYWEPAWISSSMKDLWNQGSGWENNSFFDFTDQNNVLPAIKYMTQQYDFKK